MSSVLYMPSRLGWPHEVRGAFQFGSDDGRGSIFSRHGRHDDRHLRGGAPAELRYLLTRPAVGRVHVCCFA